MIKRAPNRIRVQLDVVLDVPGERVGPLEDVPLSHALVLGLRAMGLEATQVSGGHRTLSSLEPGEPLPRRLRREGA